MKTLITLLACLALACQASEDIITHGTAGEWTMMRNTAIVLSSSDEATVFAATQCRTGGLLGIACRDYGFGLDAYIELTLDELIKRQRIDDVDIAIIALRVDKGPIREVAAQASETTVGSMRVIFLQESIRQQELEAMIKGSQLHVQYGLPGKRRMSKTFSLMGFTESLRWVLDNCKDNVPNDPFGGYKLQL